AHRGIRQGDRVAVGLANSPELVTTILGVIHAGAVLVPLNPAYTADEVTYVVRDAQASAAVVEPDHATALEGARLAGLSYVTTMVPSVADAPVRADVDAEAPALIVYTSGTTGRPKGAVLSPRAAQ